MQRAQTIPMLWRSRIAGIVVVSFGIAPSLLGSHGGPLPDLSGNTVVSVEDLRVLLGNFTGDIHNGGAGKTFWEGDLDGDTDVDSFDIVYMFEHIELGPFCEKTANAQLIYDPATGNVIIDAQGTGCPIDAYVLRSELGLLRYENAWLPLHLGHPAGFDITRYQIGEFDPALWMGNSSFLLDLGRILPVRLDASALDEVLSVAKYPIYTVETADFLRVVLPMPRLGDTDRDEDVDAADLNELIVNWTGSLEPGAADKIFDEGDFDFDGDVDSADLNVAIANWTGAQTDAAVPVSVPEPEGLWFIAIAVGVFSFRAARRDCVQNVNPHQRSGRSHVSNGFA